MLESASGTEYPGHYILVYGKLGFPAMGAVVAAMQLRWSMWFILARLRMLVYLKKILAYISLPAFVRTF